jgi:putative oxygen-independent coproporphyrinogen III oxidase
VPAAKAAAGTIDAAAIPLSLYLHFPWCVRKCPYCDFNSHAVRDEVPEEAYVDALLRDLDFELERPESRPIVSLFMGGGTPSLFSGRAIGRLLEQLARRLPFAADIEITLEANPGTADAGHFRDYRAAGVNRLSIGVQSLDDAMLRRLGRIHDRAAAIDAVRMARAAGFDNLNLDLMFALPEQSPAQAEADLGEALALDPEHLSYYQLTLEPNTDFAAHPPPLPDDETAWAMQERALALLAAAGYAQYEVSAHAREGRGCRHNRNYWQFGDYIGLGAGAHGKRTMQSGIERRARHRHPRRYLESAGNSAAIQEHRVITAAELPFEFVMNALRLNDGFHLQDFERCTGLDRSALNAPLARARQLGLLEAREDRVRASPFGRAHLNALLRQFL